MERKAFSIDQMSEDSTIAREFLKELEVQSHNFLETNWEELTEDEIIHKACFTFHIISCEIDTSMRLSQSNGIH